MPQTIAALGKTFVDETSTSLNGCRGFGGGEGDASPCIHQDCLAIEEAVLFLGIFSGGRDPPERW